MEYNKPLVFVGKRSVRGLPTATKSKRRGVMGIDITYRSKAKIDNIMLCQLAPENLGPVSEYDLGYGDNQIALHFANYWQYGAMYAELGHIDSEGGPTPNWYKFRDRGYNLEKCERTQTDELLSIDRRGIRRYKQLIPTQYMFMGMIMGEVEARKRIYATIYATLVVKTIAYAKLRELSLTRPVQLFDHNILPEGGIVTVEFLQERINDPNAAFGHGYVLAGLLAGIGPDQYCC